MHLAKLVIHLKLEFVKEIPKPWADDTLQDLKKGSKFLF